MDYQPVPEGKDPQLWHLANKRAAFKRHLATYIVVNIFLWLIWWFTDDGRNYGNDGIPWPAWASAGWGIGLFFHYIGAYVSTGRNTVEKEYEKLKNQSK